MRVLSLFDGMACGMLAMQKAGITVGRYVAYEIDKYAVKTSTHNFPTIEHRGDVFHADFTEFHGFDFLIGGSPCTYWSIAKKNNRETKASGMGWELFQQYVRALHDVRPMWFIYENNKSMSKAIRASIDEAFGFEAVGINSALVSAQHRQRLYWVGKRNDDGTYSKVDIEQPKDRGILLKDVIDAISAFVVNTVEGKSQTIKAQAQQTNEDNIIVYAGSTFGASGVAEPVRVGTYPNNAKNPGHDSQQYRIYSTEGKSVTLCGNGGGMGAKTGLYAIPVEFNGTAPTKAVSAADGKAYRVHEVKDGKITIKGNQYPIKLPDGVYIIRKLTVRECMRLQTVPEWYEFPVSDSQTYKMLGNGWTVEVIAHLIRGAVR
jgi:DNA (cytosine-5)-methyltransferase 3A